ncbi:hypothetical protein GH714_038190 [Hevea brasiliensis]|uniref:YDG domain-containing protein n=1 Tax=Hevea brasiliensis TaxID=3981 RepID=A0A6A6MT61_HEVBR|nr:hypothetical protein GH714_038190 [Hevea brasiliensis]
MKEGANMLAFTKNKNFGKEKSFVEEELMKCVVKTDVRQMGDNVLNGDAHKYRLERNVSGKRSIGGLEDNLEMAFTFKMEKKSSGRKLLDLSGYTNTMLEEGTEDLDLELDRVVVQGLVAVGNDPWRQGKMAHKPNNLAGGTHMKRKKKNSSRSSKAYQGIGEVVAWDAEDDVKHGGESNDFQLVRRSYNFNVTLPPSCPSSLSGKGNGNDAFVTRNKVRETLRLFQVVYRKLVKGRGKVEECVGVGDEFQYRVELNIIGLHRPTQGGIDFVKEGETFLATSIVASGGYDDDLDDSDVLINTGSGGNMKDGDKGPEDQKLERGNLALKNSMDAQNPVEGHSW